MAPFTRSLAAAGGLTLALTGLTGAAHAAPAARTLHLHGGMYARHAMAAAVVTQTSAADYRVKITAEGLPAAAMLHVSPHRQVYIAWIADSMSMHGGSAMMLAAIPLHADGAGLYTGTRVVMMHQVAHVFITAETTPMTHHPAMPEVTVLDSAMMH